MKICILSIGKTNISYVSEGLSIYLKRLSYYTKLDWIELPDVKQVDRADQKQVSIKEGELFANQFTPNDYVVLLDDKGKQHTSLSLAKWIEQYQLYEQKRLVMIIGGAYGFSDVLKKRADAQISLSKLTFNHQMVRLILTEQLYRAFTIIKGEPYHHE